MSNAIAQKRPGRRQIWYVRDLWADKAIFRKCAQAESLPRHLDEYDGFACVPYKSRPVIVLTEDSGRGAFACRCSSENPDGSVRPGRVRIGNIGLPDRTCLFLEPPTQYHLNYFGRFVGEAPADVWAFVWSQVKRILITARKQDVGGGESFSAELDEALELQPGTEVSSMQRIRDEK